MRAAFQEFLDLLSVALVIPRGVLQCRFHAALVVFVSWLFHSQFSLPSPSMESALLLLVLSFVLPRACLSHSCSCFHCVPTIFLLSGLVSFPHLAGLFLAMSCPDSFSQLPAQSDASGGARVGVQGCLGWGSLREGGDAKADDLYRSPVLLCLCCWDVAVKLLRAHRNQPCSTRRAPGACSLCQLGCGLSSDWVCSSSLQLRGVG